MHLKISLILCFVLINWANAIGEGMYEFEIFIIQLVVSNEYTDIVILLDKLITKA